ncbi:SMI1/KNR4 family protein [Planomonospora corallina]|uniref:SMI1/KNR4 family protein n=1 Tax=Planomonospora corallina TaxID=1806052 RepID=A0ABV8IFH5_9ACTN
MSASDAPRYPWLDLLHTVNRVVHGSPEWSLPSRPPGPISPQQMAEQRPPEWLGMDGAGEAEIVQHEERLGIRLPPSYREFLQVTNGWDEETRSSLRLLPIAEVGWTRDVDPHLAESWGPKSGSPAVSDEDYFTYGAEQDPIHIRDEYMPGTLCIAEYLEGQVYLLNPHVITPDGEWEAWNFATWYPGAYRFRSFWELMANDVFRGYTS